MDLQGEFKVSAPRQSVWDALNDVGVLKQCIPGCKELNKLSDEKFQAVVGAKLGPVNATFQTIIELQNINAPESYTLVAKSKGGAAGMGEGIANINLTEDSTGTLLQYSVEFKVFGKLAQIGQRFMKTTIQKLSDEFFSKFSSHFEPVDASIENKANQESTNHYSFRNLSLIIGILSIGVIAWVIYNYF